MACLTQGLAQDHSGRQRDVNGSHIWRHRDAEAMIDRLMDIFRYSGTFPAQQQDIRIFKHEIRIGRFCPRCQ